MQRVATERFSFKIPKRFLCGFLFKKERKKDKTTPQNCSCQGEGEAEKEEEQEEEINMFADSLHTI